MAWNPAGFPRQAALSGGNSFLVRPPPVRKRAGGLCLGGSPFRAGGPPALRRFPASGPTAHSAPAACADGGYRGPSHGRGTAGGLPSLGYLTDCLNLAFYISSPSVHSRKGHAQGFRDLDAGPIADTQVKYSPFFFGKITLQAIALTFWDSQATPQIHVSGFFGFCFPRLRFFDRDQATPAHLLPCLIA